MKNNIKSQFPIFKNNPKIVFLDSAATSQKSQLVIDAEKNFNENFYWTIWRWNCTHSNTATKMYEDAKENIANFFWTTAKNIAITRGATESLNIISNWAKNFLKKWDVVLISKFEHNSNLLPWFRLKKEIWIEIQYIEPNKNWDIWLEEIKKVFDWNAKNSNIKLCSLIHGSNVTWKIIPAKEIWDFFKEKWILFFLDSCQSAPNVEMNLSELNVDWVSLSAHKMWWPSGIWLLYLSDKMIKEMKPMIIWGGSACTVDIEWFELISWIEKFEAWTQSSSQTIWFSKACDFIREIWFEKIKKDKEELLEYTFEKLEKIKWMRILWDKSIKNRSWVISFVIEWIHPHDIWYILWEKWICLRVWLHCADIAHWFFWVWASARISFWIYNDKWDIDKFIEWLEETIKTFNK